MPDPLRVLYVDDDPGLLEIGKLFLEQSGRFSVDIITSASEALTLLWATKCDAIISDYQMPGMDGIDFLKAVRASGNAIPFILFTGRGREEIVIQALNEGADFYLQKGGDPEAQFVELVHKIQISIDRHRAAEKIQALNRLYSVLSATNKAIFRIQTKEEFFFEICRILVETGGFRMAWIGLADPEQKIIRPVASAGHVDGYLDSIHISIEDVPEGRGPTGTAFREGKYYWSNDITLDPRMEPWRGNALKRGYLANAAFAFALGTNNAGVLSVYAPVTGFFDAPIIDLLEELAVDISFYLRAIDDRDERTRAIRARQVSEERFHGLFDTINSGVAIYEVRNEGKSGKDYIIQDFNKTALEIEGKKKEEVIGKSLFDLRPTIDEYGLIPVFRKVWETGDPEFFPGKVYIDEKFSNWYENRVFRLPSGEIVAVYEDVTERKQVEAALEETSKRLSFALRSAKSGTWDWDFPTGKLVWSPEFFELFGLPPEATPSFEIWLEALHPDDRQSAMEKIDQSIKNHKDLWNEYRVLLPDGSVRWIGASGRTDYNDSGEPFRMSGICIDITERKRADEALRETEEKFREIFENANDAITLLGFTADGMPSRFTEMNEKACLISGYTREEMLSMSPADLNDPAEWHEARNVTQKIMKQGYLVFERSLIRKDGNKIPIEISTHIFTLNNRKVMLSLFRDITDRKRADQAIRQANRQLKLLTGITRHDINNQQLVLNGYLKVLQKNPSDKAFSDLLPRITNASSRISSMIQFTREYEEIGANPPAWQNCHALVDAAAKDASLGQVALENNLSSGVEIFADPLITRVFYNLMDNAVQHGKKITKIRFSARERGDNLVVICEDDGKGIPPGDKEKIFERGYGENTGLGLTLSREILAITGITIQETGEPGKGARFEITAPKGIWRVNKEIVENQGEGC